MGEERKERREYLKCILGIVVGLVIGGLSSWFAKPKEIERVTKTLLGPTVTEREMATETVSGPTVTETVTKTIKPTPTSTILYENHLDSNDDLYRFADETGVYYNAWLGNPNVGKDLFIDLVDSPVHSPPSACRLRVTKPWLNGEGEHRRLSVRVMVDDWSEFYASCWHYFPSSYKNTRTGQIMAYKEAHDGRPMRAWRLAFTPYPEHLLLICRQFFADENGVDKDSWGCNILDDELPVDEWFRTTVYVYKHPTNGVIKFWLNGQLIFEKYNVETLRYKESPHWVTVHFNYVAQAETMSFTNYFDDVIISDKLLNY